MLPRHNTIAQLCTAITERLNVRSVRKRLIVCKSKSDILKEPEISTTLPKKPDLSTDVQSGSQEYRPGEAGKSGGAARITVDRTQAGSNLESESVFCYADGESNKLGLSIK